MSRKSYKQMQNRLYREIKRRLLAESYMTRPIHLYPSTKKVDTLHLARILNVYEFDYTEDLIMKDMANAVGQRLLDDGYFQIRKGKEYENVRIDFILEVVKPDHVTEEVK